jgi:FHS family glucose/mannose:H+ symporter-like MFS transporter
MNHQKPVFAAACTGMLLFGMVMMSLGTVNSFLMQRLSLDALTIGSLAALLPFGILVGSLFFGPAVDRRGYKLPFISALMIMAIGFEILAFGEAFTLLEGSFFLIGVGGGIVNGGTNALVAEISERRRSARLSLLGFFFGVGALGMPGMTAALTDVVPYTTIVASIGMLVVVVAVAFATIRFPAPKHPQGFPLRQAAGMVRDTTLLMLSSVLLFQSAVESMVNNWTALYLQSRTGSTLEASLVALTIFALSLTVARLLLGGLLRSLPSHRVMFVSYAMALAGALVLTVSSSWLMAIIAVLMLGAGFAPVFPVMFAYIGGLYPDLTGTAFGIALVIGLAGNMLLNYLVGILAHAIGIGSYPVLLIAAVLMGLLLFRIGLSRVPAAIRT